LPTVSTFIEMFSCSLSNFLLFAIFAHSSPCIISEKIEIIKINSGVFHQSCALQFSILTHKTTKLINFKKK
jgi:hypothetical protein